MNRTKLADNRILAISPNSRGFGFAVLEGREVLVDWGTVETKYDKSRQCLSRIKGFIERYRPDVVVTEDAQKSPHRGKRIRTLLASIRKFTLKMKIRQKGLSRSEVRTYFRRPRPVTKHQIAEGIAGRFPELWSRLPPPRKPWMSEDSRMAIFDAVALALTVPRSNFNSGGKR